MREVSHNVSQEGSQTTTGADSTSLSLELALGGTRDSIRLPEAAPALAWPINAADWQSLKPAPLTQGQTQAPMRAETDQVIGQSKDKPGILQQALQSLAYSAVQAPLEGVTQILNHLSSFHFAPGQLVEAPTPQPVGSLGWAAQTVGGGIGTVLPFVIASKFTSSFISTTSNLPAAETALAAAGLVNEEAVANWALKGSFYEGIFHPVNDDGNFWQQRSLNATAGALSFAAFRGGADYLRGASPLKTVLQKSSLPMRLLTGTAIDFASGTVAGVADATTRAAGNKRLPSGGALLESALSFGVLAGTLHLGQSAVLAAEPYSVVNVQVEGNSNERMTTDEGSRDGNPGNTDGTERTKAKGSSVDKLLNIDGLLKSGWAQRFVNGKIDADELGRVHISNKPFKVLGSNHAHGEIYLTDEHAIPIEKVIPRSVFDDMHTFRPVKINGEDLFVESGTNNIYKAAFNEDGDVVLIQQGIAARLGEGQAPWAPLDDQQRKKLSPALVAAAASVKS